MSPISAGTSRAVWLGIFTLALSSSSAFAADPWISFEGKGGPGKGKHVVLIAGDEEYRSEEGLPQLAKILSVHHGFDCRVCFSIDPQTGEIDPNLHTNTPGLEALQSADLVILLTRFRAYPPEQMKYFVDYLNAGKPFIGLRTATHAFEFPNDSPFARYSWNSRIAGWPGGFGRQILGETWVNHWGHHGSQSTRGVIAPGMESSPLVRGCQDIWVPTDVYEAHLPDSCVPVIMGEVLSGMSPTDQPVKGKQNEPLMPIAWTKLYKVEDGHTARTFTTTMGAATDLQSEGLRRLIVNAAYWCVGLEDKIPEKADVDLVGDYHPTKFGFNGFQKGKRPEDYAN